MKSKLVEKVCEITGFKSEDIWRIEFKLVNPQAEMITYIDAGYKSFSKDKFGRIKIDGLKGIRAMFGGIGFYEVNESPFVPKYPPLENKDEIAQIVDSLFDNEAIQITGILLLMRPSFFIGIKHLFCPRDNKMYVLNEEDKEECLKRMKENPISPSANVNEDGYFANRKTMGIIDKEYWESKERGFERDW